MNELLAQGLSYELLFAAATAFLALIVLLRKVLPLRVILPVAALKIAIPLVYFAWFNDGSWLLEDDVMYYERGQSILQIEPNVFLSLFDNEIRDNLESQAGGSHILYGWWNAVGIRLFGEFYFAPIFLNVILTGIAGLFFYGILRESSFSVPYSRGALIFFLLHWDVLAWSSFVNLKDNGVLLLTVMSFYFAFKLLHGVSLKHLAFFFLTLSAFNWIRYYIPVFIIVSYIVWVTLSWKSSKKFILIPVLAVIFYYIFPWGSVTEDRIFVESFFYGAVRFALTPQPWSVDADYSFITLPSLLHWLTLPILIAGGIAVWRKSSYCQILIVYLGILLCFYAVVPELQGPRHRVQFVFIVALMQYAGAWALLSAVHLIHSSPLDQHRLQVKTA